MNIAKYIKRVGAKLLAPIILEVDLRYPRFFGPPERVCIHPDALIQNTLLNTMSGQITVGKGSFFGHNVMVLTGGHNLTVEPEDRLEAVQPTGNDIKIGEDVWIGSGSIILGPCTIGSGAVVAAGSVVTSDVAAGSLVAGVPARFKSAVRDGATA